MPTSFPRIAYDVGLRSALRRQGLWRDRPLPERVWRLRLVCAIAAVVATALLLRRLARRLGLPEPLEWAALFLVFSTQMFIAITYLGKLLPLYGGYEGPVRLRALFAWYRAPQELLSLAPAGLVIGLSLAAAAAAVGLAVLLGARLLQSDA